MVIQLSIIRRQRQSHYTISEIVIEGSLCSFGRCLSEEFSSNHVGSNTVHIGLVWGSVLLRLTRRLSNRGLWIVLFITPKYQNNRISKRRQSLNLQLNLLYL